MIELIAELHYRVGTQWDDQYMRLAVQFQTGSKRHAFPNNILFVGAGRLLGQDGSSMQSTA